MPPIPPRPSGYNPVPFTSTLTFKIIFIVILCLLLLIPDAFLFALTDDREERQKDTVTEIMERPPDDNRPNRHDTLPQQGRCRLGGRSDAAPGLT